MEVKQMFESGSILQAYSKKALLSVNPCFEIDKIRFSVVKLNTGGQECIDVYLDCEEVRQLCEEIKSGLAAKKISEDRKRDYPEAYTYIKGNEGSKKLSIGLGKSGILVQATEVKEGKSSYLLAPITMADLKALAFNYELVSGLLPISENSYYGNLVKLFKESENRKNKERRERNESRGERKAPALEVRKGTFKIKSKAVKNETGNGVAYKVTGFMDESTEEKSLVFYSNQIKNTKGKFEKLLSLIDRKKEDQTISVSLLYSEKDGYIFKGFPDAA